MILEPKRPLIATPISHLFEDEKVAEEIIAVSDCLEVRQRSLESNWANQRLFHIDIDITHEWSDETREYLRHAFEIKPNLELITFQATRCCAEEKLINGIFQLKGDVYSREEMLAHAISNAKWLRFTLDDSVKVGLENNNYYPTPAYDIITDSDFITDVVEQSKLYLLLDIAHAMVTAHNRKIAYQDYIDTLPMNRLIQLHICQPSLPSNDIAHDAHNEPNKNMMDEVVRLIQKYSQVEYLTIEFYRDKSRFIESIQLLRQLVTGMPK